MSGEGDGSGSFGERGGNDQNALYIYIYIHTLDCNNAYATILFIKIINTVENC